MRLPTSVWLGYCKTIAKWILFHHELPSARSWAPPSPPPTVSSAPQVRGSSAPLTPGFRAQSWCQAHLQTRERGLSPALSKAVAHLSSPFFLCLGGVGGGKQKKKEKKEKAYA